MATVILSLCLLYISSALGDDPHAPTAHLIGGASTNIGSFPFQASIKNNASNKHICGGAIITEKFVITAAHCVCFLLHPITQYYIFVGSTSLSGKGQIHGIEDGKCHADYSTKVKINDIAIIGVRDKMMFNMQVKPASILKNDLPIGTKLLVTGWGFTSYPNPRQPDKLQKLTVPLISLEDCKAAFKGHENVALEDTQFCTYTNDRKAATCKGDSGGPVTLNGVLVGLVSWGVPCAQGKPDANTKVSKFIEWIKTTIDSYCKTKTCSGNLYPKFVGMHKKHKKQ